jgi:hypothetical protein
MTTISQSLNCSAVNSAVQDLEPFILYMPEGTHQITPSQNNKAVTVTVKVDSKAAQAIQLQYETLIEAGKRPYFSIGENSHKSDIAAFRPSRFFWATRKDVTGKLATGVWCEGEWTRAGREAVEGKDFNAFSPTFFVDAVRNDPNRPAQVVCESEANPNMGALVNDPAFILNSPLCCKNAATEFPTAIAAGSAGVPASSQTTNIGTNMKIKATIAELQARKETLGTEIAALSKKTDDISKAKLEAKNFEMESLDAQIGRLEDSSENEATKAALLARRETDSDAEIERLIAAEFIQPRQKERIAELRAKFVHDPSLIGMFGAGTKAPAGLQARNEIPNANSRAVAVMSEGGRSAITSDLRGALRSIATIGAKAHYDKSVALEGKSSAAAEIGRIYKMEVSPLLKKGDFFPLMAADYSGGASPADASQTLGILSGTLVAQRTLELYKFQFPVLSAITTDFSDMPAQYKQVTNTRIISVPPVLTYDSSTDGITGRPKGYVLSTAPTTTDVNITLAYHKAVDIMFDANTLASTPRNLFGEQAEASAYAIGKNVVDALYAVITSAAFGGNAGDNAPFSVPLINYGRPTFAKVQRIFDLQGVPFSNRFALGNPYMHEQLLQDPTLVSLAVFQKPEIITGSELPEICRFVPYSAPNLPATAIAGVGNGTMAAFFGHKTSLLMQARIPNDWSTVLGTNSGYGLTSVVTNPDTGLSVLLVQFSNPQSAHAEYRLALMYGVAAGNSKGGQILTN